MPDQPGPAAPTSSGEAAKPDRKAFHPPTKFDATLEVRLPSQASRGHISLGGDLTGRLPVLLEGTDVNVAAVDSLQIVDGLTGRVKQTIAPNGKQRSVCLFGWRPCGQRSQLGRAECRREEVALAELAAGLA
jgi:hypothetical protein